MKLLSSQTSYLREPSEQSTPCLPRTSTPPQQRGNSTRLSRDDRIRILALQDAGFTYQQIAHQLQITHC
jgi:hypothetical protein